MKKIFIPSINSQTNKNFKLIIACFDHHYELIKNEINDDVECLQLLNFSNSYRDYLVKNNVKIQTRHDCDDYMSKNYVDYIQKMYEINKHKYDDFILNFHPTKIDFETDKEYSHIGKYYKVCSMFSSLIQDKNRKSIMDLQHTKLDEVTKNIIYIEPNDFVKLTIHKNNKLSKFLPGEQYLNKKYYE
jgi:hypothetical protein